MASTSYLKQSELYNLGQNGVKTPINGYKFGKDGIIVPVDNNSYSIGKDGTILPKQGYTIGKNGIITKTCDNTSQVDSQLRPSFTTPKSCPKGCARWDNLAADGNTKNQNDVNAMWSQGSPPEGAGNNCAQPINNQGQGPWCFCAGTNDDSMGMCQDRNLAASACKAVPNGLNNLNSEISSCTSSVEHSRNNNFAENTFKLQQDITTLSALATDSLSMGDAMFGQFGHSEITKEVKNRNEELKAKKEKLLTEVEKGEATIERSNRDFSDVKDTLPQPQPKRVLRFIEDYTLAILSISYLFMIIAAIYIYTSMSDKKLVAFFQALISSGLFSMFLFMLLFYLV